MTPQTGPLISVVMPSYNHAAFIGRAAASVLEQTYSNLELIIVDNNSSDGTDSVLAAIKDPRFKVVKFSNNGVIAASRNLGIKSAAGEYVAFIDSDDIWLPGKLAAQTAALEHDPAAALAYCRFRTLTGTVESDEVLPRLEICASGEVFKALYRKTFIACSGVMARRRILLEQGGFCEERALVAIEDTDLWLRIARDNRVVLSSAEPLFLYRVHPGNLSRAGLAALVRVMRLSLRHGTWSSPWLFISTVVSSVFAVLLRRLGLR